MFTPTSRTQVPIEGFKLATMCELILNRIEEQRKKETEAYIQARLQHALTNRWDRFWRMVFQRPDPTYESVLAEEKSIMYSGSLDGFYRPLFNIKRRYQTQEEVVKKLLAATAYGSPVYVGPR